MTVSNFSKKEEVLAFAEFVKKHCDKIGTLIKYLQS